MKGFYWPRVETRLLIALFFLPFGTPDSGTKCRRYQVFIRYHWASAGMTKGNRLWKRKRNVLRRDDYFYFHHYSFQICITDQAWGQYMAKFLFCILLDFILWTNYRGFDSQRFVLLLFSVLQVGRLPKHWFISFSRLPFPTSFARTLNVPMVHCAILSLAVAFSVLQTHLRWDT